MKFVQENLLRVKLQETVLKLTQVGGLSILRRSGEYWLRNSAKWPRKLAIRGASEVEQVLEVTVNRQQQLFIKNTGPCEHASGGIRSDACPVPVS